MFNAIYNYGKSLPNKGGAFEKTKSHWEISIFSKNISSPEIKELTESISVSDKKGNVKEKTSKGKEFSLPYTSKNDCNSPRKSKFLSDSFNKVFNIKTPTNFKKLIEDANSSTHNKNLTLLLEFLNNDVARDKVINFIKEKNIDPKNKIIFSIDFQYIHLDQVIIDYWNERCNKQYTEKAVTTTKGVCLVTGKYNLLARTWKPLTGLKSIGISSGAPMCSGNENAFLHYNKKNTYNSPASVEAEYYLSNGFQDLIDKGKTIKDVKYIYWTEHSINIDPFDIIQNPQSDDVSGLLASVFSGDRSNAIALQDEMFYMASLSGNGARIIIKGWYEESLATIKNNLIKWFEDIEIYDSYSKSVKSGISLNLLLYSTLIDSSWKTEHPSLRVVLIESALKNIKIGSHLLNYIVDRDFKEISKNNKTPLARLAMIKLCMNRNVIENHVNERLIMKNETVGYLCGKLMGVLDSLHWSAMKESSTLYRRIYGASVTPKAVIGELVNRSDIYVNIANNNFPGSGTNRSKEITELVGQINDAGGFPVILNKHEQSEFCIGFHSTKINKKI
jgi:CRISPR-associated protein Cas8c/Csd1 subtype I-C